VIPPTVVLRPHSRQYVANATRPDISFAVNRLATYTANPSTEHYSMIKQILRYLAGTRNYGITYRKSYTPVKPLIGYTDATFANTDEQRSTTGLAFISSGGAVLLKSKKQTIVALSTSESEYIALAHIRTEVRWYRNLYSELQIPLNIPITIRSDSLGAISMANNPFISPKSRHIDLKYHSIRQLIDTKTIIIEPICDADQTADILTKALPRPKHKKHVTELGLAPV
jgi:hypothetical protein